MSLHSNCESKQVDVVVPHDVHVHHPYHPPQPLLLLIHDIHDKLYQELHVMLQLEESTLQFETVAGSQVGRIEFRFKSY